MGTFTSKLGLYKPAAAGEVVNVVTNLNANMDIIDQFSGSLQVNDGVTPADENLYDGLIVQEATSGRVWVARANGLGGFTKKYINYPWSIQGTATSIYASGAGGSNGSEAGISTWQGGIGSSISDIVSARVNLPVRGVYVCAAKAVWDSHNTGRRSVSIISDAGAAGDESYSYVIDDATQSNDTHLHTTRILFGHAAGTKISLNVNQNSGAPLGVFRYLQVALIATY